LAATDVVFSGLYQMIGLTVAVIVAGLDCGDYVVDPTGSVTVPINSDPGMHFNGAYLQQFNVGPWDNTTYGDATTQVTMSINETSEAVLYIPVVIGFPYLVAGQLMRPSVESQTKSSTGGGTGKNRRVHNYAMLVSNAQGLAVGTTFANLEPVKFKTEGGVTIQANTLFSGVIYGATEDVDSYDGMICWTIQRPFPCMINSVNSFVVTEER
jgi:hypothetical protein